MTKVINVITFPLHVWQVTFSLRPDLMKQPSKMPLGEEESETHCMGVYRSHLVLTNNITYCANVYIRMNH